MKAHQVRCKRCAGGVNVVTYQEKGTNVLSQMLVASSMSKQEAVDYVCGAVAQQKTAFAVEMNQEAVYNADDIKAAYTFNVEVLVVQPN